MRTAAPPPLSEKAFLQQVTGLASILGWHTYHPWLSIHSPRGWPDLALVRPPRLILAELKTAKGKVSESQERWAELLKACPGVEYYLWRPADIDEVAAILQSKATLTEHMMRPSRLGPDV